MLPTRRGRILILAGATAFAGARALGVDALYVIAVAGVTLPFLAMVQIYWAERHIEIRRGLSSSRAFAGDPVRVEIAALNPGRMPAPPLLIEDAAPASLGGPVRLSLPSMPGGTQERLVVERRPAARGRFTIGPLDAILLDPFGLASVRRTLVAPAHLVVYPRVESLDSSPPSSGAEGWGAATHPSPAIAGDEFYAVRQYQTGDDLRRIHWRSVARTGHLMIRQNEARPSTRLTVLVDTRRRSHRGSGASSSLEWALSAAASVLWHLAGRGYTLRLATGDRVVAAPGAGRAAADSLLEALAVARPAGDRSLLPVLRELAHGAGASGVVVAILPPPTAAAAPELAALARLRASSGWCAAILLDTDSFADPTPRRRADADQRLADAGAALTTARWPVVTAGVRDRFPDVWNSVLSARASRPSWPSRRS